MIKGSYISKELSKEPWHIEFSKLFLLPRFHWPLYVIVLIRKPLYVTKFFINKKTSNIIECKVLSVIFHVATCHCDNTVTYQTVLFILRSLLLPSYGHWHSFTHNFCYDLICDPICIFCSSTQLFQTNILNCL